jgi:hypothetical protein
MKTQKEMVNQLNGKNQKAKYRAIKKLKEIKKWI